MFESFFSSKKNNPVDKVESGKYYHRKTSRTEEEMQKAAKWVDEHFREKREKENTNPEQEETNTKKEGGIPMFITKRMRAELKSCGVTEEEIKKLRPEEAWELLQKKKDESNQEGEYTMEDFNKESEVILEVWKEALSKMQNVNGGENISKVLNVPLQDALNNSDLLQEALQQKQHTLMPEEKFFLEISTELIKLKNKGRKLFGDLKGSSNPLDNFSVN